MRKFLFRSAIALVLGAALGAACYNGSHSNLLMAPASPGVPPGTCAESTAFLARVSVDTLHRNAYNTLICGMVSAGFWVQLDALYVFATQNQSAANLNLISSSFPITPQGGPNFLADNGYLGVDGSQSVYLATGYNPLLLGNHFQLGDAHAGVWSLTDAQSAGYAIGSSDGINLIGISLRNIDNVTYGAVNAGIDHKTTPIIGNSSGFYIVERHDQFFQTVYRNNTSLTQANGATAIPNLDVFILNNNGNNTPSGGVPYRIALATLGAGLSAGDVQNYYTLGCAFLTTVRGSC